MKQRVRIKRVQRRQLRKQLVCYPSVNNEQTGQGAHRPVLRAIYAQHRDLFRRLEAR